MASKVNFLDKVLERIERLDLESVQSYVTGLVRERKQIEEILDQINEGLILLDREGIVKYANRRAFFWLGFQRFLKGRSSIEALVEDPSARRWILQCLKHPSEAASEELKVFLPREMFLRFSWTPIEGQEEKDFVLVIENTTQEKNQYDEAAQLQRIEGLVRLAAGVAHEIGNPLNSIQIHLKLLEKELAKQAKGKREALSKFIEIISSETKRLDQIVRSFLRATRRSPLRFRKESINEVLEEAVEFLRLEMGERKIKPQLRLDKNLPVFLLDRDRLYQAFINLMKNAVEAMPKGGELRISTTFREKLCLVRFEDEGEGIDEEDLPHIFEPYYTTKEEGSGLGLSQVYEAIREHGGRIDVKSRLGKGSVFTLALPVRQERLSLPQPEEVRGGKGGIR